MRLGAAASHRVAPGCRALGSAAPSRRGQQLRTHPSQRRAQAGPCPGRSDLRPGACRHGHHPCVSGGRAHRPEPPSSPRHTQTHGTRRKQRAVCQRTPTETWPCKELPQKAPRCRRWPPRPTAFGGQEPAPQQPRSAPCRGSADTWPARRERLCHAGKEQAGKPGDGPWRGHPSQPGTGKACLSSPARAAGSSPRREDGGARRSTQG